MRTWCYGPVSNSRYSTLTMRYAVEYHINRLKRPRGEIKVVRIGLMYDCKRVVHRSHFHSWSCTSTAGRFVAASRRKHQGHLMQLTLAKESCD